ncbi:hypothetical protein F4861DRAFT_514371 [Xylaria intraflava]|nr:hypothetical protein F4861DRAFT_514371 [Xylaria intraflava]
MEKRISQAKGTPCRADFMLNLTKDQWHRRMINLLSTHLFSFIESDTTPEACDIASEHADYTSICLLRAARIELLIGDRVSLAERCLLHFNLAVSVVHELMHALMYARYQRVGSGARAFNRNVDREEPVIDGKGVAELGFTMESLFFGGAVVIAPSDGIPITAISFPTPNLISNRHNNTVPGDWSLPGTLLRGFYIPASWTSMLLSEAFWKDKRLPKKSVNYFHRPAVFGTESRNPAHGPRQWSNVLNPNDPDRIHTASDVDKHVIVEWNQRTSVWRNLRMPWYDSEKAAWEASPWSFLPQRIRLHAFIEALSRRDEVACAINADSVTQIVPWTHDRTQFYEHMPSGGNDLKPDWVFHCIGLLMMATIPIRPYDMDDTERNPWWTYTAVPSRRARAAAVRFQVSIDQGGELERTTAPRSVFFDHIRNRGEIENGFSQLDYLDLVLATVNHIQNHYLVHYSWVTAILDAHRELLADRQRLRRYYPRDYPDRWASTWYFKMPKYNKRVGRFINGVFRETRLNPGTGQWEFVQ